MDEFYFRRIENQDGAGLIGAGRRPTDEEIRDRIAELQEMHKVAPDVEDRIALQNEIFLWQVALGERPYRTFDCGTIIWDRTEGERAIDHTRVYRRKT